MGQILGGSGSGGIQVIRMMF